MVDDCVTKVVGVKVGPTGATVGAWDGAGVKQDTVAFNAAVRFRALAKGLLLARKH